jgi:hypothetical protein
VNSVRCKYPIAAGVLAVQVRKGFRKYSFDKAKAGYENDDYCRFGSETEVAAAGH